MKINYYCSFGMAARKKQVRYYQAQRGYGDMRVFRGQALQRGHGIGGLFKGLMRVAMPLMKKGLLHVGKRALNAGAKVLEDVSQNKSLKESVKNRAGEAFNPLNIIKGATGKRKSNTSVNSQKKKVKRVSTNRQLQAPQL